MTRRFLLAAVVLGAACAKSTPTVPDIVCSQSRVPALAIKVQNGQTQAFIGAGAMAVVTSGTYADTAIASATAPDTTSLLVAYNKVGVFSVSVRKQGYSSWFRDSVTVETVAGCDRPATVHLNATLQPKF